MSTSFSFPTSNDSTELGKVFQLPTSGFQDLDEPSHQHHHGDGAKQGHLAGFEDAVAIPIEEKGGNYDPRQPTSFDDFVAEETQLSLH